MVTLDLVGLLEDWVDLVEGLVDVLDLEGLLVALEDKVAVLDSVEG